MDQEVDRQELHRVRAVEQPVVPLRAGQARLRVRGLLDGRVDPRAGDICTRRKPTP